MARRPALGDPPQCRRARSPRAGTQQTSPKASRWREAALDSGAAAERLEQLDRVLAGSRCRHEVRRSALAARLRRDRRVQAPLAVGGRPPARRRRGRRSPAPTSAPGARAMSVLVDERFGGSWDDLRAAREATTLPLLAKGFFSTRDAPRDRARGGRRRGAPAPARPRRRGRARRCSGPRARLGLDTLVEAHDAEELDARGRARRAGDRRERARPLDLSRSTGRRSSSCLPRAPRDRDRDRRERHRDARAGRRGRARRRERDPRRLDADARARPGREAARARLSGRSSRCAA